MPPELAKAPVTTADEMRRRVEYWRTHQWNDKTEAYVLMTTLLAAVYANEAALAKATGR